MTDLSHPGSTTSSVFYVSIVMSILELGSVFQKKIIVWKWRTKSRIVTADSLSVHSVFFPCFQQLVLVNFPRRLREKLIFISQETSAECSHMSRIKNWKSEKTAITFSNNNFVVVFIGIKWNTQTKVTFKLTASL